MSSSLQLTSIQLRVSDLARSLEFYSRQIGFVVVHQTAAHAKLAIAPGSPPLLTLDEDRSAPTAAPGTAGLFHAALLLPSRAALGAWLRHAADAGVEFDGFSDHGVSEAIYFNDPDRNGLEFYCDRPRDAWPYAQNGQLAMVTRPLAIPSLLAGATPPSKTPLAGAHWGHLHLSVNDLDRTEKYYRTNLGLALTQDSFAGARFLAADGYHHHLGLNTWSRARAPQPPGALGLASATFAHASQKTPQTLTDPNSINLHLLPLP